ncbi:helix-turn-helix domain-containing protein [Glycomyces albidus]|uniref:Helix-turn-helix domain-containing protein n=1 Tax=Glycomyces albidus TaxID=2656774 RepID=A0A6L5GF68_9ACTN|nr:helix-turn-helix domain-containing protein [Glycomyces albidus]MQM28231.1 helix-turn-helix domain-containing protein [Glycomyces albidus]
MTAEAFPAPPVDGQRLDERAPVPALRRLVSAVWVQQTGAEAAPYAHRRTPSGAVELVCRIGSAPMVLGPLTGPRADVLEPGTALVGMRFIPGAFRAVAAPPASELSGIALDARELWGPSALALADAVDAAASPQAALAAMQRHVLDRVDAAPDPLVSAAVHALMPWRATEVTSLHHSLHLSETQLRRRFRSAVGLAPKPLHRILRFQGFLALVQRSIARGRAPADDGLAALAVRAGYADQSHLTRECVRLTGAAPRAFLAETHRNCACGHDHAASFTPVLRAYTEAHPGDRA